MGPFVFFACRSYALGGVITYTEEKVPPQRFFGHNSVSKKKRVRFRPNLKEMNPTSLPNLFKPLRSLSSAEKIEKIRFKKFEKINKILQQFLFTPLLFFFPL